MTPVETVSVSTRDAAISTIVLAFSADPVARWFYPNAQRYLEYFPEFVKAFAAPALEHGTAYCTADCSGAALWIPPGIHPDEERLAALAEQSIPERQRADALKVLELMAGYHPPEAHWYLPMIGVDPGKQGSGIGSALLRHALDRCDAEGRLAYLEASSTQSPRLYERHGFEVIGLIQVGSSAPLFPMVRKPRRSGSNETSHTPLDSSATT